MFLATSANTDAPVPAAPLLEREQELLVLVRRCAELSRGQASGSCVVLSGEAGIGKTSLLQAAQQAAGPGVEWLWGTCEPMLSPAPFGPLVDWLDRMPPSLAAAVRSGRQTGELLAGLMSMLRDAGRPKVVVIDDAQWADGATLDLLRYVSRRIDSTRALLILCHRDDALAAEHPLLRVLAGLPASRSLRVALGPLTPAGVAELARLAGRSDQGLYSATQGNPFFVTELLAGHGPGARAGTLPASVRDAVLARLLPLPESARDVVELTSISPAPLEVEVVDAVVDDAPSAIAACTAAGLLVQQGPALRFRHELARQAVEASLPAGRAASLHAAVFDALSLRGATLARLVHHAARAGLAGAVRQLAPQAAREAAQASAHRQAAALYELALVHAAELPLQEQAALHAAHSVACQHIQRTDEALASRLAAQALHRQLGDRLEQGRDLCELAVIEQYTSGRAASLALAHQAIELLQGLDAPVDLAVAYGVVASLLVHDSAAEPAAQWAEKALALLEGREGREGADECRSFALANWAAATLRCQDAPQAWARLQHSLDIALLQRLDSHVAHAYLLQAAFGLMHRRHPLALAACEAGLAFCEAHDLDTYRVPFAVRLGHLQLEMGQWDAAEGQLLALRELPALAAGDAGQVASLEHLINLRRGRAESQPYWDTLLGSQERIALGLWVAPLPVACCEAAWLCGDDARVLHIATQALQPALADGEGWRTGQLACWLKRAGGPVPLGLPELPQPCRLELAGELRAAAQAWSQLGCSYQQALVLLQGGIAELEEGLSLLDALGATPAARVARRRLRAAGARVVPRGRNTGTRADPLGLTTRERQVLELLAQRLSNSAIAERLHRSERTVENHVAALLGKLGAANRQEAVLRAGLEIKG
jgi:DNA-binding CsgD family transcriptional regulator